MFEVEHLELGRRFALKLLECGAADRTEQATRLARERRALGPIAHPNVVGVTDAGHSDDGRPFTVMDRLVGQTLRERLKRGPMLWNEASAVACDALSGLAAAHAQGIVHRDVKPGNVFLCDDGTAKILDFGMARAGDSDLTAGFVVGSPRYMSPEQALGEAVDARSDVYSLALVLFEAIAGHGPFEDAPDPRALMQAQINREPPRLRALAPTVPRWLDELVARALAKDPADRPQSAVAMRAALERGGARKLPWVWAVVAPVALVALAGGAWWGRARAAAPVQPLPIAAAAIIHAPEPPPPMPVVAPTDVEAATLPVAPKSHRPKIARAPSQQPRPAASIESLNDPDDKHPWRDLPSGL